MFVSVCCERGLEGEKNPLLLEAFVYLRLGKYYGLPPRVTKGAVMWEKGKVLYMRDSL